MKGGVERSTRGAATAAQTLTDIQNGVVERTVQKALESLAKGKVNGGRNTVLYGPVDANGKPSVLVAGLNPFDIKVAGGTVPVTISFAGGIDQESGPIDHVVSITVDETLTLTAADSGTKAHYIYVEKLGNGYRVNYTTVAPTTDVKAPAAPTPDLHWYEPTEGVMQAYNGTAWEQKERVFIGVVYTTTTGLGTLTTYEYNQRTVPPAMEYYNPVILGQFGNLLSTNGWQKFAGGLILQWGVSTATVSHGGRYRMTLPIAFPNNIFAGIACEAGTLTHDVTIQYLPSESDKTTVIFYVDGTAESYRANGISWFVIGF